MIHFSGISKQYGPQVLFRDASFQILPGSRSGLVGPNGAGKTSIFRLIMGEEEFDAGEITKARNCVCGYFSQDVGAMSGRSALQEVMSASEAVIKLGVQIRELEAAMGRPVGVALGFLHRQEALGPRAARLLTTISGCFIRLFLATTPWMQRAIWSAPPPVPAGTTSSTGLVGSHAAGRGHRGGTGNDASARQSPAQRQLTFCDRTFATPPEWTTALVIPARVVQVVPADRFHAVISESAAWCNSIRHSHACGGPFRAVGTAFRSIPHPAPNDTSRRARRPVSRSCTDKRGCRAPSGIGTPPQPRRRPRATRPPASRCPWRLHLLDHFGHERANTIGGVMIVCQ